MTADSAYAGEELKQLPDAVTWTTRLRVNAALHGLPPERTGKKGRPRVKGDRLPSLAKIAAAAAFSRVRVTRYGKRETTAVHAFTCLWYSVTGAKPVTVILIRDKSKAGFDLALVTTEKNPDIARVIERYAAGWAIEVAIEDSKQLFGTGQARNRTAAAVERTVAVHVGCMCMNRISGRLATLISRRCIPLGGIHAVIVGQGRRYSPRLTHHHAQCRVLGGVS